MPLVKLLEAVEDWLQLQVRVVESPALIGFGLAPTLQVSATSGTQFPEPSTWYPAGTEDWTPAMFGQRSVHSPGVCAYDGHEAGITAPPFTPFGESSATRTSTEVIPFADNE